MTWRVKGQAIPIVRISGMSNAMCKISLKAKMPAAKANYKLCRFALFPANVINLNERHLLLQVPAEKFALRNFAGFPA